MDKLKWIDEELRAEKKLCPNENQVALAHALENDWGGDWRLMATLTFRPNDYEEYGQHKNDEFYRNMKVSWLEGERIVKRVGRDGQMRMGGRGISPGWMPDNAERMVHRWIRRDPGLRKTRWFVAVEAHKQRNCSHAHVLFSNARKVNWERARDDWFSRHGRFQVDQVKDDEGMAMYLAKSYVGKEYGSHKFRMSVSRNAREGRARKDDLPKLGYAYRMMLFKNDCRGGEYEMMSWRAFQRKTLGLKD